MHVFVFQTMMVHGFWTVGFSAGFLFKLGCLENLRVGFCVVVLSSHGKQVATGSCADGR